MLLGKDEGEVHPRTGHEGPKEEYRYSLTLSLTPAALLAGKTPYPLYRRLGLCRGAENLAATGIRSPDRPASSESLY